MDHSPILSVWFPMHCCRYLLHFCLIPLLVLECLSHGQGSRYNAVSSVPAVLFAWPAKQRRWPPSPPCSISVVGDVKLRFSPLLRRWLDCLCRNVVPSDLLLPVCKDQAQMERWRDWQSKRVHFVAIRKKAIERKITKFLTFLSVIIHFCPLSTISSLFQFQYYLPCYSSTTQ